MSGKRIVRPLLAGLIVAIGLLLVSCGGDDDGGDETAATSPAATDATTTSTTGAGGGGLSAGEHTSEGFATAVTFTVSDGWVNPVDNPDFFVIERSRTAQAPLLYVAFLHPGQAYNPTETALELGPPPEDFVAWIESHRLLQVEDKKSVSVGGLDGTQFEITTDNFGDFGLFETSDGQVEARFQDHLSLIVLGAVGSQLIVSYGSELPTDFDAIEADAEEVLATVQFGE
jgi:hypothetical protein